VGALASFVQKYLCTAVGQHITQDLRQTLYRHVQRLSLPFFETRRTGDMIVRLTSDVDAAQDFLSSGLLSIAMDLLTLGGMLAVMLYLDWRFTLLALAVTPLLYFVVYRRTHRIKEAAREVKARESGLASIIQESLASIRIVRAFAREPYEEARLEREGHAAMQAALRARSIKAALPPMVDLIVAAGTAVVMLIGVRLVLEGRITSGTLIVFVLYLGKLYKPIKSLGAHKIKVVLGTPTAAPPYCVTTSISNSFGQSFPVTNKRSPAASYAMPLSTSAAWASRGVRSPSSSIHPVTNPVFGEIRAMR